ncbi:hypothetical protein [Salinispora tropica]|uniref:Uncharacterized protein n=1 Tax=Salinispora tropica (strain ATCC BAA-916 / DSM 44818 / JCM 13857 / NBRC 105044 / CNB-440) TaxID=369723 RepID=A4X911_SALTO|nr:hypothetical protein [Salinispora tropica]ABP55361.1 hypothetical protein Strop_2923 [Salinispora tropica CNB-440]
MDQLHVERNGGMHPAALAARLGWQAAGVRANVPDTVGPEALAGQLARRLLAGPSDYRTPPTPPRPVAVTPIDRAGGAEMGRRFHFLGCHDDQVKIRGHRVELREIEVPGEPDRLHGRGPTAPPVMPKPVPG